VKSMSIRGSLRGCSSITTCALTIGAICLMQGCGGDTVVEPGNQLPDNQLPVDSAASDPCESDFDFQRELNGAPDAVRSSSADSDGRTVNTVQHWYAENSMVVSFSYVVGEEWCNVWNESGVVW